MDDAHIVHVVCGMHHALHMHMHCSHIRVFYIYKAKSMMSSENLARNGISVLRFCCDISNRFGVRVSCALLIVTSGKTSTASEAICRQKIKCR